MIGSNVYNLWSLKYIKASYIYRHMKQYCYFMIGFERYKVRWHMKTPHNIGSHKPTGWLVYLWISQLFAITIYVDYWNSPMARDEAFICNSFVSSKTFHVNVIFGSCHILNVKSVSFIGHYNLEDWLVRYGNNIYLICISIFTLDIEKLKF